MLLFDVYCLANFLNILKRYIDTRLINMNCFFWEIVSFETVIGRDTHEFYLTHGSASRSKAAAGLKHQGYSAFDGYSLERYRICLGLLLFIWRKNRQLLQVVNSFCSQWKELTWRMKAWKGKSEPCFRKEWTFFQKTQGKRCYSYTRKSALWDHHFSSTFELDPVFKFLQQAWHLQGTFK